jgi:hypothetical protein
MLVSTARHDACALQAGAETCALRVTRAPASRSKVPGVRLTAAPDDATFYKVEG